MQKEDFGKDFIWGVSTAAYQIEGAHDKDGKGPSIWDTFVSKRNKIFSGHTAKVACNFYESFHKDLYMMYRMHIPNHRFSVSWSRILPEGSGRPNYKGIDFYNRMIDFSLELGISPWLTLYHWDLPESLSQKGGWTNRDILSYFQEYTQLCLKHFGDRVKNWMVLNEPAVFTAAGYFFGLHAPGKKGLSSFLPAAHHAALTQALGARIIKQTLPDARVGTTFSCSHIQPYSQKDKDILAAKKADLLFNRFFLEPLLGLGYPLKEISVLERIEKYFRPEDPESLAFNMDFIGLQNYTREIIKHSPFVPYLKAKIVPAKKRQVPLTAMDWEVYPQGLYHMLKKYSAYPGIPQLIVTENGAAFADTLQDGAIDDPERLDYLQQAISAMLQAKNQGVNIGGYFVWTFLENFEWAAGYHPRFGLVHVDFASQKRTIKASGHWYADFLK